MIDIYKEYMYSYPHKKAYGKINELDFSEYADYLDGKAIDLYLHIPFCNSKCGYCNLFSCTFSGENLYADYLKAVEIQAAEIFKFINPKIKSFTIGGGTPFILSADLINKAFEIAENICGYDRKNSEACIETSPMDTDVKKLRAAKENGVNRISIGIQSFVENELRNVNRKHDPDSVKNALSLIKNENFDILNADIIYGLPEQTKESLIFSLENLLEYSPDEIFLYPLYIRQGKSLKNTDKCPDKRLLYDAGKVFLEKSGYSQISMRKFSKKITEISTCGFDDNIALGVGGRTYLGNINACVPYTDKNSKSLAVIEDFINNPTGKLHWGYVLNTDEQKRKFVIKNILTIRGLETESYREFFASNIFEDFPILKEDFFDTTDGRIFLKDLGLSDYIGPKFISAEVRKKMRSWEDV